MMKSMMLRSVFGFLLGLTVLPAILSYIGLYAPYLSGISPLFGGMEPENILFVGYELTAEDVHAFMTLSERLNDLAYFGLMLGAAFGYIGAYTAWFEHLSIERKLREKS